MSDNLALLKDSVQPTIAKSVEGATHIGVLVGAIRMHLHLGELPEALVRLEELSSIALSIGLELDYLDDIVLYELHDSTFIHPDTTRWGDAQPDPEYRYAGCHDHMPTPAECRECWNIGCFEKNPNVEPEVFEGDVPF